MAELAPLSFGDFVLSPTARTLLASGEPLHLTPKAFDLMVMLVSRRPAAVSKADIHAELWPGVFVSDVNVAALIFELRAALGESARAARYIRTVHGFGYAFAGEASPPRPSLFRLVMDGHEMVLFEGENIVGRGQDCRVRVESAKVSRRHARLLVAGRSVTLEDCGSSNGTWVNSERIDRPVTVTDGAEVRFGTVGAVLRQYASDEATEPVSRG
jgi:hypothetical protein